jgi:hypothetical protein
VAWFHPIVVISKIIWNPCKQTNSNNFFFKTVYHLCVYNTYWNLNFPTRFTQFPNATRITRTTRRTSARRTPTYVYGGASVFISNICSRRTSIKFYRPLSELCDCDQRDVSTKSALCINWKSKYNIQYLFDNNSLSTGGSTLTFVWHEKWRGMVFPFRLVLGFVEKLFFFASSFCCCDDDVISMWIVVGRVCIFGERFTSSLALGLLENDFRSVVVWTAQRWDAVRFSFGMQLENLYILVVCYWLGI